MKREKALQYPLSLTNTGPAPRGGCRQPFSICSTLTVYCFVDTTLPRMLLTPLSYSVMDYYPPLQDWPLITLTLRWPVCHEDINNHLTSATSSVTGGLGSVSWCHSPPPTSPLSWKGNRKGAWDPSYSLFHAEVPSKISYAKKKKTLLPRCFFENHSHRPSYLPYLKETHRISLYFAWNCSLC